MAKTKTISKKCSVEWMLADNVIDAIEACKHGIPKEKGGVEKDCELSEHSCYGFKPGTKQYKQYKPGTFDCMCLVYGGLCPAKIKPEWRKLRLTLNR